RMLGILRERAGTSSVFRAGTSSVFRAAVVHANALEDAQALAEDVRAQLGPEELYLAEVSPVIGTHTGPGTLGICIVTR
ncbi:MAG: DegV family protein, partial [Anaerolineae bacterium]